VSSTCDQQADNSVTYEVLTTTQPSCLHNLSLLTAEVDVRSGLSADYSTKYSTSRTASGRLLLGRARSSSSSGRRHWRIVKGGRPEVRKWTNEVHFTTAGQRHSGAADETNTSGEVTFDNRLQTSNNAWVLTSSASRKKQQHQTVLIYECGSYQGFFLVQFCIKYAVLNKPVQFYRRIFLQPKVHVVNIFQYLILNRICRFSVGWENRRHVLCSPKAFLIEQKPLRKLPFLELPAPVHGLFMRNFLKWPK